LLGPGVHVEFLDAGHIPGSASLLFSLTIGGNEKRVLFSGDLGNELSALILARTRHPMSTPSSSRQPTGQSPRSGSVAEERTLFRNTVAEVMR